MRLLLPQIQFTGLCMTNCPDNLAVLNNSVILSSDCVVIFLLIILYILSKALLLGVIPILVKIPLSLLTDLLCPDSC